MGEAAAQRPFATHESLLRRLAGSAPEHRLSHARLGGVPALEADPRLLALLPAAPRAAAVLVGIQEQPEGPAILLTVRAAHLRHHAGQIAFPGGLIEAVDAGPAAAALREASEEVGLAPDQARVLGYLPDQYVLTGFRITPVVAQLPPAFSPRLSADEVASSFLLPLSVLLDPGNERVETRTVAGIAMPASDLLFGPHRIWGATAGILFSLRSQVLP